MIVSTFPDLSMEEGSLSRRFEISNLYLRFVLFGNRSSLVLSVRTPARFARSAEVASSIAVDATAMSDDKCVSFCDSSSGRMGSRRLSGCFSFFSVGVFSVFAVAFAFPFVRVVDASCFFFRWVLPDPAVGGVIFFVTVL